MKIDINRGNVDGWKKDVEASVDFYNQWFLKFAPKTFCDERSRSAKLVRETFRLTRDGSVLSGDLLLMHPEVLPILRQMTCPPIARDRLAGLSYLSPSVVKRFEDGELPRVAAEESALRIVAVLRRLVDEDLLPWIAHNNGKSPTVAQRNRAALVIADRLCGALSDPLIRNAQEKRQLASIAKFLEGRGYRRAKVVSYGELKPGEYAYHLNIKVALEDGAEPTVNIPVDVAILPQNAHCGELPLMIEAKSAGDFANVNKRRKEEAQKIAQLKRTYGDVNFVLFLCGYFDGGYLGYEASEGIDWIWEHRISDMAKLGL